MKSKGNTTLTKDKKNKKNNDQIKKQNIIYHKFRLKDSLKTNKNCTKSLIEIKRIRIKVEKTTNDKLELNDEIEENQNLTKEPKKNRNKKTEIKSN